jgi:N,N-dimethylformamidase
MTNPYKIVGYCDRPSVRHGGIIKFMVSTAAETFTAGLVRLSRQRSSHRKIDSSIEGRYPGKLQGFNHGSYVRFDHELHLPDYPALEVIIRPTRPQRVDDQAILCWDINHGLFINSKGHAEFRWANATVCSAAPLPALRWYRLSAKITTEISLLLHSFEFDQIEKWTKPFDAGKTTERTGGRFCIAACRRGDSIDAAFDGKIEAPRIATAQGDVIAEWDFSLAQQTDTVIDTGRGAFHGALVNCPQRAMTGHNWRGTTFRFTDAPEEYGAIAFHCDDLSDACWEPSLSWEVPSDLTPGIYGIELEADGGYDCIPFVLRPVRTGQKAKVVFLLPTFSHLAYANERHWWPNPAIEAISGKTLEELIGEADRWTAEQSLLSVYDLHKDRTGCCHSSWSLPQVNMRPGYVHPLLQGPHQLGADLYITDWLDSTGISYDVITDHDLHFEGLSALEKYQVLLTGQHPEYVSANILDALTDYTRGGGNIMYIGGQGFFFVTSTLRSNPNVIEVRRGKFGIVPWYSEPGEFHHAATGELGGAWALRGREPHMLFGVGCAGVMFGPAAAYYRTDDSRHPDYDWIFDGVEGDRIYAHGDLMGGPAGFEFDRVDYRRGSPTSTVCLATARDFEGVPLPLPEDLPSTGEVLGETRCDIAYYEVPDGGAVFSTGSMTWSPCLMVNDGDNDIARITRNVLERFIGN